jgi:hypothetical protein
LDAVAVELDEQCEMVTSMTSKLSILNLPVSTAFAAGAMPQIQQISPCAMRLKLAGFEQNVFFPFPIVGSQHKIRLARKSRYVEVGV